MSYVVSIILTVVVPLFFGYIVGRNHIDPNTPEGKIYYDTH